MKLQLITLPNSKELLFISRGIKLKAWQRVPELSEDWEPLDLRILEHTGIPGEATVLQKEV